MVCTGVTVAPSGETCTIRRLSRSVTSADPSGRNAIPHGTARFSLITVATTLGGPSSTELLLGGGRLGGAPPSAGSGGPKAHPAVARTAASRTRVVPRRVG